MGMASLIAAMLLPFLVFSAIGWFVRWSERRRRGERLPMGTPVERPAEGRDR
jgi:hypothetical protein